jgi:hypothetical protein
MNKLIGGLVIFAILAALALGLLATGAAVRNSPAVLAAIAEQEQARAAKLAAEADTARAQAAGAWAWVDAAQALAGAVVSWAPMFVFVVLAAFALLVLRLAWAATSWAQSRASLRVIRADSGPVLAWANSGRLMVLDTARNVGGVAMLDEVSGALRLPLASDDETHLQLSGQALAAGTIARVAGQDAAAGADVVERVGGSLQAVLGSLSLPGHQVHTAPAPMATDAPAPPALRYMRVITPETKNREAARLDAGDLAHFVTEGAGGAGFGRAAWLGRELPSGRKCRRSTWTWMSGALESANLLTDGPNNTRVLAVELAEALERLDLRAEAGQAG